MRNHSSRSTRNSDRSKSAAGIARSTKNRLEVVAVPGAGKTTMLTNRVKYLVENASVQPERILVVSFANATVDELRNRLEAILGSDMASRVTVRTVHSLALEIATSVGVATGAPAVESSAGQSGKSGARAKKRMFKRILAAAIPAAAKLRRSWKGFQHLVVDEYQDCSPKQTKLIALLSRRIPNLFVVGDPWQVLYGFAGGKYTPLSDVLPGVHTADMDYSYRLTERNATFAAALVSTVGRAVTICADKRGPRPVLVVDTNERRQIKRVRNDVVALLEQGVDPQEIAILARTKATLRPFEAALLARDVRSLRIGNKVALRHAMKVAFLAHAVARRAAKPIRVKTLRLNLDYLDLDRDSLISVRDKLDKIKSGALEGVFAQCARVYSGLIAEEDERKAILHDVNRWVPLCRRFDDALQLRDAMRAVHAQKAVVTSTINKAKGREWQHVFIVGVIDGLLPIFYATCEKKRQKRKEKLAEERRLLYVAASRASHSLRMYESPAHHARSRQRFAERSRFLAAPVEQGLVDVVGFSETGMPP